MSDITAAAEEAVAIARGEQAANRVYVNGVFYVPEEKFAAITARVEELKKALQRMIDLCTVGANPGAFDNGNLDSTGTIDEGDFIAGRIIDEARAAITKGERK